MCEICDGKTRDDVRREFLGWIARHDYAMVTVKEVWARDRSWVAPGFSYTVGLWQFRKVPELIVVGTSPRHAADMIDKYARLSARGKRFGAGGPYHDFVPGIGTMFELVANQHYPQWLPAGFDLYPTGDYPAFQLLWPNQDSIWPWDPKWSHRNVAQPVLTTTGRPESWPAHAAG
jgi:hypothetical protein